MRLRSKISAHCVCEIRFQGMDGGPVYSACRESLRTDFSMVIGCLFLAAVGTGAWSLDRQLWKQLSRGDLR